MEGQEKGANIKDRTRYAKGASVLKSLSSQLSAAGVSAMLTNKSPPFKNGIHREDDLLFLSWSRHPFQHLGAQICVYGTQITVWWKLCDSSEKS